MTGRLAPIPFAVAACIGCAAILAACNSSSNTTPAVGATPTPVPSTTPSATPTPAPATTTLPVPAAATSLPLPGVGGYSLSVSVGTGATPAGTTVTASGSLGAPANAPAPSAIRRRLALAGATPFYYETLTFSQTISTQYFPAEALTMPSVSPTATYDIEIDDITQSPATKIASFGPATIAGLVAQYTNTGSNNGGGPPSFTQGHTYLMLFYTLPATATPTPTPTSSATITPTPTPTSSGNPTATPTASPAVTPTPTPTPTSSASVNPNYVFNGMTSTQTFTSSGGAISVGAYQGVTLNTTWGSNNATSSFTFTSSIATGSGDIAPTTFPLNTGNGHVVTYMEFTATPSVSFAKTPNATLNIGPPASFGGTSCTLWVLNYGGQSTPVWRSVYGGVAPSGNSLNLPSVTLTGSTIDLGNPSNGNQSYLSVACQ